MNRWLADSRHTGSIGGLVRCACGLLGCMAMVGVTSFGMALPAQADHDPHPRRTIPPECRTAVRTGDRHAWRECREAWRAMREEHRRASLERFLQKRRAQEAKRIPRPPASSKTVQRPSPRPVVPLSPVPTPLPPSPSPTPTQTLVRESAETTSLQPLLLLGLLLPAAAAIGYPLRRRIYAVAGSSFFVPAPSPAESGAGFTYRPAIDPFALPVFGLTGHGAAASARILTLIALEECGDTTLVIIPRPDATALFGLSDDDLLDETGTALFIPGNLDSALAYLETELAIRRNTGGSQARRLLLVADCGTETDQINEILDRHPGEFAAILMGDWPGDKVSVDENGLVNTSPALSDSSPALNDSPPVRNDSSPPFNDSPPVCSDSSPAFNDSSTARSDLSPPFNDSWPALSDSLPERLPAMSRTEARDRLNAALRRHRALNTSLVRKASRKRR